MKNNSYFLEIVVFMCGALVMIFELAGARVLGPYFGTSMFVWTSIIGIILGSLSLGYFFGGKIADKRPTVFMLSAVVFFAGLFVGISYLMKEPFLVFLSDYMNDARLASVVSAIVLFSPASFFLGMVSPYAVKLIMDSLKTNGATIGRLYSLSTAGSIFGTFLAGFYLIPKFGTNMILIIVTILLFLISFALSFKRAFFFRTGIMLAIFYLIFSIDFSVAGRIDLDTPYSRVWIYDYEYGKTGRMVKKMGLNNENHSSMFLDSDELVNEYTKYYDLFRFYNPEASKFLMLGGAAYSYPKYFLDRFPEAFIDVVEIDAKMTELAKKYFRLKDNERLGIFHEDGRVFLNKSDNIYDVILGDAFTSKYSVPYQLTTLEAVQKKYDLLSDNGLVILNVISAYEGDKGMFLRAEYATYKEVFPKVMLFTVRPNMKPDALQNIILVALKSDSFLDENSADKEISAMLMNLYKGEIPMDLPILTDDYAPVDYYMNKAV